ncbi:MAG TPA: BlaI/MecI/CopY family transcriptional regulator [Candidatus Binataceae bacterium]|nr:BlaI/MecI/CopY family transcriptional regulator [Candidatus Binataceae bacterium]
MMSSDNLKLPGGELEYAVLFGVCELNAASVREVHRRVGQSRGLAYTTIAKVLERLHAKGLLARERKGPTLIYCSRIERKEVELARARLSLSKLFASDVRPAMATLVEAMESLDSSLIDELERAVAAHREKKNGP